MTPRHPGLQLRERFEHRVDNRIGVIQAIRSNLDAQANPPNGRPTRSRAGTLVARQPQFAPGQAGVPLPKNHSRVLTDRNTAQRSLRSLEHVLGIGTKKVKSGFLRAHPCVVQRGAGLSNRHRPPRPGRPLGGRPGAGPRNAPHEQWAVSVPTVEP